MSVDLEFDYETATSKLEFYSESDIQELHQWIQKLDKSKSVPKNLSNKQLVLFYNAFKGNMEEIRIGILKYYNYRRKAPEIFNNRTFKEEDLKLAEQVYEFTFLPEKSVDGYQVLCYRLQDNDYKKFTLDTYSKLLFMTVDLCLFKYGPQAGYIYILDMQGVQLGHILKMSPTSIRKMLSFIQEAMLLRVQACHIINALPLIDKIMFLCKPFLKKKFHDIIQVYKVGEHLEKLTNIVPKSGLPFDLGGTLPDRLTLHRQSMEQLKILEPYFRDEEDQRRSAVPDEKLAKSFRKLDID